MQDFSFVNKMNENEAYLFKRCVRRLLDVTFILEEKEERLYRFIADESNLYNVNAYLSLMGYQVVLSEQLKVAMLQPNDEDRETVGLKVINLYHFDQKEMRLLIVLWLLFLERMRYKEAVYVTVGEIIDKCQIYQISLTPAEFKHAYRIFRRFSLIDYSDDINQEDGKVRLYPSLQFCMDIEQLKMVIQEYTQEDTDGEDGSATAEGAHTESVDGSDTDDFHIGSEDGSGTDGFHTESVDGSDTDDFYAESEDDMWDELEESEDDYADE